MSLNGKNFIELCETVLKDCTKKLNYYCLLNEENALKSLF